jgi:DNA invertase Pin-like site-specific DNA recombinase
MDRSGSISDEVRGANGQPTSSWGHSCIGQNLHAKDMEGHGRPMTAGKLVPTMKRLRQDGVSKRAIAKQLGVSRTSVIRLLRRRKRA